MIRAPFRIRAFAKTPRPCTPDLRTTILSAGLVCPFLADDFPMQNLHIPNGAQHLFARPARHKTGPADLWSPTSGFRLLLRPDYQEPLAVVRNPITAFVVLFEEINPCPVELLPARP